MRCRLALLHGAVATVVALAALLHAGAALAEEAPQDDPAVPAEGSAPRPFLGLTEVNERAERTTERLGELEAALVPSPEVATVGLRIGPLADELAPAHELADERLDTLSELERGELQRRWILYASEIDGLSDTVSARAAELQLGRDDLARLLEEWQATAEIARDALARDPAAVPAAILERIDREIEALTAVRDNLRERLDSVLTLESRVSALDEEVRRFQRRLDAAGERRRARLFRITAPPLWSSDAVPAAGELTASIAEASALYRRSISTYVSSNPERWSLHGAVLLGLLGFTLLLGRRAREERASGATAPEEIDHVERRPFSSALLLALMATIWIHPVPPRPLREIVLLVGVIPLARILVGLVGPRLRRSFRWLLGIIVLDMVVELFFDEGPGSRFFLTVLGAAVLAQLVAALRAARHAEPGRIHGWWRVLHLLVMIAAAAVGVGLLANLAGAVMLSHLLVRGVADAIAIGAYIGAFGLILRGVVYFLLRRRTAFALRSIQIHQARIERLLVLAVDLWLFALWFKVTARMLGVYLPLARAFDATVSATWQVGDAQVSIASIGVFVLALVASWALARAVRVLLAEEIFARFELPRGVPGTISMLTGYAILGAGALFAVSAAGVDMGKLSFIAGGLGVGIGFGLQNVVQNFVSGLILAFERPVQVGDVVTVGSLTGKISEIGVRSSHMRTFDGAEVVIPNGGLISKELVNWTLSDQTKRLEIPVMVELGADPHRVIEVLLEVAAANPKVHEEPAPLALFKGFGETGLSFSLLAWVDMSSSLGAGSELALAAHDALKSEGMDVPIPRRDVRMRPE